VQVFKRVVKYRSTRYPELVAVNHWMAMEALAVCRQEHPDATQLYDELHAGRDMSAEHLYDNTSDPEWLSGRLTDVSNQAGVVRHLFTHACCCACARGMCPLALAAVRPLLTGDTPVFSLERFHGCVHCTDREQLCLVTMMQHILSQPATSHFVTVFERKRLPAACLCP
jgi:hypothetical protein